MSLYVEYLLNTLHHMCHQNKAQQEARPIHGNPVSVKLWFCFADFSPLMIRMQGVGLGLHEQ